MPSPDDAYPTDCAFCSISAAYPSASPSSPPIPHSPNAEALSPQCHLLLSTPHLLAFLDIMPMAPAHILLTTRTHYRTLADLHAPPPPPSPSPSSSSSPLSSAAPSALDTARALGEWLPILSRALCRTTGVEDWNVVQNNGARAAQVVPHVHFHIIPRYQEGRLAVAKGAQKGKSWTMFGRGPREELDDEEGREMAEKLRAALREVLEEEEGGKGRSRL